MALINRAADEFASDNDDDDDRTAAESKHLLPRHHRMSSMSMSMSASALQLCNIRQNARKLTEIILRFHSEFGAKQCDGDTSTHIEHQRTRHRCSQTCIESVFLKCFVIIFVFCCLVSCIVAIACIIVIDIDIDEE